MLKDKELLTLLPYRADAKISEKTLEKRILSLVLLILQELIGSIQDFYFKNNFTAFDPHVGENLCQIRASKVLDIYFESDRSPSSIVKQEERIRDLRIIFSKAKSLLEEGEVTIENRDATVISYLNKHELNIQISHNLFFLMLSRFLTKFRKINDSENTMIDYPKLIESWGLSKNISRRIIHQYQKHLSQYSYDYIEYKALQTQVIDIEFIRKLQRIDDDARYTLPCYIVTKVLLADLKEKRANVLFVVRNENTLKLATLFYKYDRKERRYVLCLEPAINDLNSPCFVLHGISNSTKGHEEFRSIFDRIGVEQIIGLDSASHPQYSGKKLSHLKNNPFEPIVADHDEKISELAMSMKDQFLFMKKFSKKLGCSNLNYDLIFIRHIFCDRLDSQLAYVKQEHFYSTMPISAEFV